MQLVLSLCRVWCFYPKVHNSAIFLHHMAGLFRQYSLAKCVLGYSRTKKRLSRVQKHWVKKVWKLSFFQREHSIVFFKNLAIFPSFFLGNTGQENVFYDILERKNAFLAYKGKKFKKLKNIDFSKGVNPWFAQKMAIFSSIVF